MSRKQEACRAKKRTHLSSDFLDTMQVNDCIVFGALLAFGMADDSAIAIAERWGHTVTGFASEVHLEVLMSI